MAAARKSTAKKATPTRVVAKKATPTRVVAKKATPTRVVAKKATPTRVVAKKATPTRVAPPATSIPTATGRRSILTPKELPLVHPGTWPPALTSRR